MVIDSEAKQDWLKDWKKELWLSLTDYDADNKFQWEMADGSKVDLVSENAKWGSGEPSNYDRDEDKWEHCVNAYLGEWFDKPCHWNFGFVCEKTEQGACFYDHRLDGFYCLQKN